MAGMDMVKQHRQIHGFTFIFSLNPSLTGWVGVDMQLVYRYVMSLCLHITFK